MDNPLPLIGHAHLFDLANPHKTLLRLAERHGPVVRLSFGLLRPPLTLVSDPAAVSNILEDHERFVKGPGYAAIASVTPCHMLVAEGCRWRAYRTEIGKIFNRSVVDRFVPAIRRHAAGLCAHALAKKTPSDIQDLVTAASADVIFEMVTGTELGAARDLKAGRANALFAALLRVTAAWQPGAIVFQGNSTSRYADLRLVLSRCRKEAASRPEGLLAEFVRTCPKEMIDAFVTSVLIQGFRNTSAHACWMLAVLGENRYLQDDLREELSRADLSSLEGVDKASLLDRVSAETLRLYPSVPALSRISHDDFAVAGHVIPAGSEIVISPYVQHRLSRFWNHPEHFAPSRFSTPASEGTYFPHGGGRRVCAARSLGIAEAKLIVAEFVSRSIWAPLPGSDNLRQCVSVALRPAKLGLKFSARA